MIQNQELNNFRSESYPKKTHPMEFLLLCKCQGILNRCGSKKLEVRQKIRLSGNEYDGIFRLRLVADAWCLSFGMEQIESLQNKAVGAHLLGIDLLEHSKNHVHKSGVKKESFLLDYGFRIHCKTWE